MVALRLLKTRVQLQHALDVYPERHRPACAYMDHLRAALVRTATGLHVADGGGRCHADSGHGLPDAPR